MLQKDFELYKKELSALTGEFRSRRAIEILQKEKLSQTVDFGSVLLAYINGTNLQQWQHFYLINASIPYYNDQVEPPFYKRFLYWVSTFIMEQWLDHKTITVRGEDVKLRFSAKSGSHTSLIAGYGKNCPDFHIFLKNSAQPNQFVEYKFATKDKFKSALDVFEYYKSGKHLHGTSLLITFLEQEKKFYLIDYLDGSIQLTPIPAPLYYVSSDYLDKCKVKFPII